MSLLETIPEELRSADKLDEFIAYLYLIRVPVATKKYMLLDWCEFTGVAMQREFAERAGIPQQF